MFLCNQSHLKKYWKQKQKPSRHLSRHLRITSAHGTAREKKKKWVEENKNRCFWHEVNTVHVWSDLLFQFPSVSQCHKQGKQHYWVNQGLEILTLFWNYDVKLPTALGWSQLTLPALSLQCRWHVFFPCVLPCLHAEPLQCSTHRKSQFNPVSLHTISLVCDVLLRLTQQTPTESSKIIGKSPQCQVSGAHWGRQAPSHLSPLLEGETKGSAPGCLSTDVHPTYPTQSGCREAPKHHQGDLGL